MNERVDKPISHQEQDLTLFSVDFFDEAIVDLCQHEKKKYHGSPRFIVIPLDC
ncbi:MAG: hypothetical protein KBD78_09505 [Oligoflexales bacterium]|nr:hypothetical protein [Oligoflexales bacterium]